MNYTVGPTFTVLINTEVAHDLILSLQKKKKRLNTIEPLGNLMEMKRNSWIMGQETLKRNPSFMTHSVLWIFHKCPRGAYGQAGKMGITHTHT